MKMCGFTTPELVKKGDYLSLQHMLKIMQCNLEYEYASPTTRENLTTNEFHELVACIRDKPLRYRNRAVAVIANYEGVPTGIIARCSDDPTPVPRTAPCANTLKNERFPFKIAFLRQTVVL